MSKLYSFFLLLALVTIQVASAQVAINTTGNNANSSAMLDVESTTKGLLIPRMITSQRTSIVSPATGLLVYDLTTLTFWYYTGSAWTELNPNVSNAWSITGNSNTNVSTNFIGTTDLRDLKFRVANTNAGTIAWNYNVFLGSQSANSNPTGTQNTGIGGQTMYATTTGEKNTAVGYQTLFSNLLGSENTAIGNETFASGGGNQNTAVGASALGVNSTGSNNTVIGYSATTTAGNLSNATAIGSKAAVSSNNSLVLGSINGVNGATADVNVGIGIASPTARLHIKHNSYPTSTLLLEESENDFTRMRFINTSANSFWEMNALPQTTNTTARIEFWNSSSNTVTTPFVLYGNGNATLLGTLTQNSDYRLKKNIEPIHNALSAISTLNGYTYNWKDASRDPAQQIGVIAQEVQKIFPELVKEDNKGVLSVNYSGLIPVLIEAIKEQQKEIDELKKLIRK